MTYIPPSALVERVAKAVRRNQFERTHRLSSFDENVPPTSNEMDNARAALAATPLGELVEALEDIAGGMGKASPPNAMLELGPGEFHKHFVPLLQSVARAALARAKGETP
jgi:hypothetical protein